MFALRLRGLYWLKHYHHKWFLQIFAWPIERAGRKPEKKSLYALGMPCLNRLIHESRKRRKMEVNHMYNGLLLSFLAFVLLSCGIISRTLLVSVHVAKLWIHDVTKGFVSQPGFWFFRLALICTEEEVQGHPAVFQKLDLPPSSPAT